MLLWLACQDPRSKSPDGGPGGSDPGPTTVPGVRPMISGLAVAEDPVVPLVRVVTFDTVVPAEVTATATSDRGETVTATGQGTHHALALVGLRFDRAWDLRVEASAAGLTDSADDAFETGGRPEHFPTITLHSRAPTSALDHVLVSFNNDDRSGTWLVVLDADAEPVWVFDAQGGRLHEAHATADGVRFIAGSTVYERTWAGGDVASWSAADVIGVEEAHFHHEVAELDDGRLMALAERSETVDDLPTDYDDPTPQAAAIAFDEVVVWSRDGSGAERWPIPSLLDTSRIGYDSLEDVTNGFDWGHANAATYAEDLDAWLVSVRHQDAVVAVNRSDGTLRWILANPDLWAPELDTLRLQPVGDVTWPFHAHSVRWLPGRRGEGRLVLLDNGNNRVTPLTGDPKPPFEEQYSRAVVYRVDDAARTVREAWAFEPDPVVFASSQGSVEPLPGDHYLVDFSSIRAVGGVRVEDLGLPYCFVRMFEVDPTGAVLWDLEVRDPGTGVPPAWYSYRAHPLATFPPGE
jgi:hypothetical protein